MRTIYLRKEYDHNIRKILVDMAYLVSHKQIRLLKEYYEDGIYLPFTKDLNNSSQVEKYYLTKDKIKFEDQHHYFFDFPFKSEKVENVAK